MRGGSHKTLTVRKAPQRAKNPNNNNKLKKTNTSSIAMSRAQQQPWAGAFDWSLYRDIITQLYIIDDHPLKEVEEIMRKQFNFHATQKMYKDHFRKWGLRKNLSSQFVEDFLIRTRQQPHSPPGPSESPNGSVVVRNWDRRMHRYVRSGSGLSPDAELSYILTGMNRSCHFGSPGSLGPAEQSLYMIRDYVMAMDTMSSKNPRTGPLGPAYSAAAGKTYYWITLIGIARNFLYEGRTELGFALLNQCFEMFKEMLDPNPLAHPCGFLRRVRSCQNNPRHAFHTLFAVLRKAGPEGVYFSFERVIMDCYMDLMASSFSRGFLRAYPLAMQTIEAPLATVQKAFDSLKNEPNSLLVKPMAVPGQPESNLEALVSFPKDSMDDFLHGWAQTRPPSTSPSPSATPPSGNSATSSSGDSATSSSSGDSATSSSSGETTTVTTEKGSEYQRSNRAESPQVFDSALTEIIMNKVIEETSVELHHGNLSVTARMMDLKKCFNPSAEYSDIEELKDAYEYLVDFYAQDPNIYLQ
ncbi:hypothetical protein PG988_000767 [Apiospora saccharicola]